MKRIFIVIILLLFFVQGVFALTANSSNYSVDRFGTGMATATPSSTNYNSTILSEAKGTTRNAISVTYTGNVGFFSDTIYYRTVSITSYSISPASATVGSPIGLYILALNPQSVWAKITSPNSQEQTLSLLNGQTVNYVPSPSLVGRYTVIFYANSSTGAIASAVDYFDLTAQTTTPSGGGGGGTATIIEKCQYNWDCTPWGVCSNGKQRRECKNIGTCTGNESKPIEEMGCSEALFDISLRLKIGLTENRTLVFNVDLAEKKGVDEIDAYIRYSILNKEGYEIFSQIETKAIQNNLSYTKEIGEIQLVDGKYTLIIDILYGNLQRASAEQRFEVENGKIKVISENSSELIPSIFGNIFFIFAIVIILLLILIVIILLCLKKLDYKYRRRLLKLENIIKRKIIIPLSVKTAHSKHRKKLLKIRNIIKRKVHFLHGRKKK